MKNVVKKILLLLVCLLSAFLVSDVLLCMIAAGMYLFHWGEGCMRIMILITYGLSAGVAGYFAGRKEEKKLRYLFGALEGLFYFLILLLISLIFGGGMQGLGSVWSILFITVLCALMGSLIPYKEKKK